MRYSRLQKNNLLPKLNDKNTAFQELVKRQQAISNQISNLNNVLDTQNLTTINGLIFTGELKNRLFDDIVQCIHKEYRLIAYGFEFWQENTIDQETIYVRKEIFPQKLTFKQKLHQISIKVIQSYEQVKKKQLKNIQHQRWRINSSIQSKSSSKTGKRMDTSASQNITPIKRNRQNHNYSYFTSKKMVTQMPETQKKRVNFDQVQRTLKKISNIVTIWLPPKTYPQFYGILVPLKMEKLSKKCIIKKYIFFKQGLNEIFFRNIIQYLSLYFKIDIQELQMKMTKQNYSSYFQRCGWKMKSWQGTQKINAIFSKK